MAKSGAGERDEDDHSKFSRPFPALKEGRQAHLHETFSFFPRSLLQRCKAGRRRKTSLLSIFSPVLPSLFAPLPPPVEGEGRESPIVHEILLSSRLRNKCNKRRILFLFFHPIASPLPPPKTPLPIPGKPSFSFSPLRECGDDDGTSCCAGYGTKNGRVPLFSHSFSLLSECRKGWSAQCPGTTSRRRRRRRKR